MHPPHPPPPPSAAPPVSYRVCSLAPPGVHSPFCPLVWANDYSLQASTSHKKRNKMYHRNGADDGGQTSGPKARGYGAILPPQTFPSRLTDAVLRPKARDLHFTSSHREGIQHLGGCQDPTPLRTFSHSLLFDRPPPPPPRASFSPLETPEDTWVLKRPPLPQALSARHP